MAGFFDESRTELLGCRGISVNIMMQQQQTLSKAVMRPIVWTTISFYDKYGAFTDAMGKLPPQAQCHKGKFFTGRRHL